MCEECYVNESRITPLLNPRECLENHMQYVCGTCGRCICIGKTEKRLQRWNFPFQSFPAGSAIFSQSEYREFPNTKAKKLTAAEVCTYMKERSSAVPAVNGNSL